MTSTKSLFLDPQEVLRKNIQNKFLINKNSNLQIDYQKREEITQKREQKLEKKYYLRDHGGNKKANLENTQEFELTAGDELLNCKQNYNRKNTQAQAQRQQNQARLRYNKDQSMAGGEQAYFIKDFTIYKDIEQHKNNQEIENHQLFLKNERASQLISAQQFDEQFDKFRQCVVKNEQWSGDQILHNFASISHNNPILPSPIHLQLYLFNQEIKTNQSSPKKGQRRQSFRNQHNQFPAFKQLPSTFKENCILARRKSASSSSMLMQDESPVQLVPKTLVCPYIEQDQNILDEMYSQNQENIPIRAMQSAFRMRQRSSGFAPLINQQLARMSQHLPVTFALTHYHKATQQLKSLDQDDKVEMRQSIMERAANQLNSIHVWKKGCLTPFKKFRFSVNTFVLSLFFENLMTLCVTINTIGLSIEHYGQSQSTTQSLEIMNLIFTVMFIIEMALKLFGLGLKTYLMDPLNYLDGAVVIVSILQLTLFPQGLVDGSFSAFRTFRIFRTFRVLRVARLLRSLKQMQMIVSVISRSVGSFAYLALLLLLFLLIYTLLGMQLFKDQFNFDYGKPRGNFDDFNSAFITVFQLLTLENWQIVLFSAMKGFGSWSVLYFLTWIFVGNFVLLNLFLAILLDSFLDLQKQEQDEQKQIKQQENMGKSNSQIRQRTLSNRKSSDTKYAKSLDNTAGAAAAADGSPNSPRQRQSIFKPFKKKQSIKGLNISNNNIQNDQLFSRISLSKNSQSTFAKYKKPILQSGSTSPRRNKNFKSQQIQKTFLKRRQSVKMNSQKQMRVQEEESNNLVTDLDDSLQEIKPNTSQTTAQNYDKQSNLQNVACDKSYFTFSRDNCLRKIMHKIYINSWFEKVILILIVLSSVKLAADTYFIDSTQDYTYQRVSQGIDYFFTAVFVIESLIKSITLGIVLDKGSYLREGWNILDFIIVLASIADLSISSLDFQSVRVLRLVRTIRPLRVISHKSDLKIVVAALLHSMSAIVNVAIVVFFVWLIFSIFGVSQFGGKFQFCSSDKYVYRTKAECEAAKYTWATYSSNFDNVINAMQTLFIVSSLQGWPQIMHNAIDSTQIDMGPILNNSPAHAYYFIVFIFIGSFFLLNLFVGVMFINYKEAKKFDPMFKSTIKQEQARWIDIMRLIYESKPDLQPLQRPKRMCRLKLYKFVMSDGFDIFIIVCIILNMIGLALSHDGAGDQLTQALWISNLFFTGVFTIECLLKIIVMGKHYFYSKWNIFDFGVVLSSLVEIPVFFLLRGNNNIKIIRIAPQNLRIFRVLRVARILRLINKSKGLQALIFTILFAIRSLINIFILLILIFFIYAVLGVFLFHRVRHGKIIGEYTNFFNFGNSMITLLRIATGQDWNRIMTDCYQTDSSCIPNRTCGSAIAPIYFFSFVIICSYVMLNLFILVIIQQFDEYYLPKQNIIESFKKDLAEFKQHWFKFSKRYRGRRMKSIDLNQFFRQIQPPLGMKGIKPREMVRKIISMNIKSDTSGLVYFHMLLFKTMRQVYGSRGNLKPTKLILSYERAQYKKIKKLCASELNSLDKSKRQTGLSNLGGEYATPFFSQLYLQASFKKWFDLHRSNTLLQTGPRKYTKFKMKRSNSRNNTLKGSYSGNKKKSDAKQSESQQKPGKSRS